MEKTRLEYQTTVLVKPYLDGRMQFERPQTLRQKLLQYMVPILWLLVLVVVVAAFFWQ